MVGAKSGERLGVDFVRAMVWMYVSFVWYCEGRRGFG